MMQKSTRELNTGWSMKQADDISDECWLPVKRVPSQVHIDLIANEKYALLTGRYLKYFGC